MEEGVHRVDLNGVIVFENRAAARMLGWELDQLLGRPAHLTMHHTKPDGTPYTLDECPIYATFRDGVSRLVADEVFWRKDGTSFPVEYATAPIRNDQNEIVASVVTFRDVTERKRVKDALKLFRALVDQSNDAVEVVDPETGCFLDINEKGHLALGYSREELLALSVFDLDPTVSQAAFPRIVEDLRKSGAMTWEGIRKRKDGSTFPVEVNLKYVPLDRDYVVAVVRDITERKGAEEQLRLHATALEAAANAIVITNRDGTIVWVNPAFTEFTGYTLEEAAGQKPSIIRSGEHDAAFYKTLWDTILSGQPWQGEMINRRKDGTTYFEEQTITPVMDETGEITNFIAIKQDVTERKQAEEALSESQERYHDLIENSLDIIYTHDLDGNYTSANKAVEDILGYTIEEAVTKNFATTVVPEDIEKATQMSSDLLAGKEAPVTELDVFAKDGHRVSLEINAKLIQENGVPVGIQGVARDVTERKHLEEQLRQSQKLESIGRLAGGIAHDFNNMLTAINGYSELALRRLTSEDPIRPNIEEIKKAGERSALLTNQLLAFSRRQILRPETIHINDNINDTTNMLQRLIGEDIELEIALEPNVGSIKFDPGQLSQIIMNLAVNARDAMPDGGKLTIETANVFLDPEYASGHVGVLPGAYVMLSVADNGTGMPPEVQEQIFEPFFTTKEVGKGTGLGLATVYGIVKQSGGNIRVYSEVRGGTTFKIYIPRVIAEDEIIETREPSIKLALGGETILLAEDESTVRSLSRKVLEACGYSVIEAANGIEALEIFKFSTADIDLLFTDVVMPGMGGRELAEKLLEINPNLPVLFSSGYTDDAIVMHGVLDANVNFIQKPFTLDNLARIVRDLLDAAEIARKHGK
jgi:PAS domain S-box-containing protein